MDEPTSRAIIAIELFYVYAFLLLGRASFTAADAEAAAAAALPQHSGIALLMSRHRGAA